MYKFFHNRVTTPYFRRSKVIVLEELHELGLRVIIDGFNENNTTTVPTHQPCILVDDEDKKRVGTVL